MEGISDIVVTSGFPMQDSVESQQKQDSLAQNAGAPAGYGQSRPPRDVSKVAPLHMHASAVSRSAGPLSGALSPRAPAESSRANSGSVKPTAMAVTAISFSTASHGPTNSSPVRFNGSMV